MGIAPPARVGGCASYGKIATMPRKGFTSLNNLAVQHRALGQLALADEYSTGPGKNTEGMNRKLMSALSTTGRSGDRR